MRILAAIASEREMEKAKYKVLSKVFIGPPGGMEVVQPDQVIEYDGIPSIHMEPVNELAKAAYADMLAKKPYASRDPLAHLPKTIDPKDALLKPLHLAESSLKVHGAMPKPGLVFKPVTGTLTPKPSSNAPLPKK